MEEHIGEFLDSESGINPIDRDTVKVGAGIYVEDFGETTSLPMFTILCLLMSPCPMFSGSMKT